MHIYAFRLHAGFAALQPAYRHATTAVGSSLCCRHAVAVSGHMKFAAFGGGGCVRCALHKPSFKNMMMVWSPVVTHRPRGMQAQLAYTGIAACIQTSQPAYTGISRFQKYDGAVSSSLFCSRTLAPRHACMQEIAACAQEEHRSLRTRALQPAYRHCSLDAQAPCCGGFLAGWGLPHSRVAVHIDSCCVRGVRVMFSQQKKLPDKTKCASYNEKE